MRQWTWSVLVQVMNCRLFGAKPLSEPIIASCQLDSWEHISVKFESEFIHFHSRKYKWKCVQKWRHFVLGRWVKNTTYVSMDSNISLAASRRHYVIRTNVDSIHQHLHTASGQSELVYQPAYKWLMMMTSSNGNIVRVTGHLCGEFTGHRWIPRTKASDAELWCFLWSAPE